MTGKSRASNLRFVFGRYAILFLQIHIEIVFLCIHGRRGRFLPYTTRSGLLSPILGIHSVPLEMAIVPRCGFLLGICILQRTLVQVTIARVDTLRVPVGLFDCMSV